MISIKPTAGLIPRFNIDYYLSDFISSLVHLREPPCLDLFNELFDSEHVYFTNSGRTSLYVILKALNLPPGSNVGIPLYTCTSDFDAIVHAGHNPVFIDIDPDNYTIDTQDLSEKISNLDAIIVVHALGRPADLEKIQKIAGNRPVIEDCAHSLLSRYKGDLTGTIATAGFFSFRTGKYISAGEGGMIVTKSSELASNIDKEIENLSSFSMFDEIKHAVITFMRSALYHRPWFGLVSLPLGKRVENKVDVMNKYSFNKAKIRTTDLHVIARKMRDFQQKVSINRNNSNYLIEQLRDLDIKLTVEVPDTYCNYFLFPMQFGNEIEREHASEALRKEGVDTAKLFSRTPELAKMNYGYNGDCPNTEHVADRVLVVPNYYTLNGVELDRIARVIKNVVN